MNDLQKLIDAGRSAVMSNPFMFLQFEATYQKMFQSAICLSCPGSFDTAWKQAENLIKKKEQIKTS